MALTDKQKEKISLEVIKVLATKFRDFPESSRGNRNAPFHMAFLNAFSDKLGDEVSDMPFFISLTSWLHGLNTTLGMTFFENVAHILCDGEKREYTSQRMGNLHITQKQRTEIGNIMSDLNTSTIAPNLTDENNRIFQNYTPPTLVKAMDFSADVFYETTDEIVAIELKTVKPNSGGMRDEKHKILEGKAALYRQFPNKRISFYLGFPFDPTVNPTRENVTSYDKVRFLGSIINMNKYFDSEETLIASELWNFLSGTENTMEEILEIINAISTVDFPTKYQLLKDNARRNTPEYHTQLQEWNLFSEKELIENDALLQSKLTTSNLQKIYNKMSFDEDGKYNKDRYNKLKGLLR